MEVETPLRQAIKALGGQSAAAVVLKRAQSRISNYVTSNRPPADVCMRIEVATNGQFLAEHLRPDLADDFKAWRQSGRSQPKRRAA